MSESEVWGGPWQDSPRSIATEVSGIWAMGPRDPKGQGAPGLRARLGVSWGSECRSSETPLSLPAGDEAGEPGTSKELSKSSDPGPGRACGRQRGLKGALTSQFWEA